LEKQLISQEEFEKRKAMITDKFNQETLEKSREVEIQKIQEKQSLLKAQGKAEDPQLEFEKKQQELQKEFPDAHRLDAIKQKRRPQNLGF
jgi:hypothetical protein